jgi:hypothetical protein
VSKWPSLMRWVFGNPTTWLGVMAVAVRGDGHPVCWGENTSSNTPAGHPLGRNKRFLVAPGSFAAPIHKRAPLSQGVRQGQTTAWQGDAALSSRPAAGALFTIFMKDQT